ncbi:hypothetical protein AURDEDRAFT_169596 [Auricularia subglabra TFB-10046 SS5]|uniref:Uncharacterized protein n=1 Tax=Auricularia subglabra (strain TFB-10046 / SS5) TaxID=717982 RepID=J0LKE0_AURST|nr:hypothetical protein AURDEDRAFT_169596 [Auricularia subglabra TFB-10046 SS5]
MAPTSAVQSLLGIAASTTGVPSSTLPSSIASPDASCTSGWDQAGRALDVVNSTSTALSPTGVVGGAFAVLGLTGWWAYNAVGTYKAAIAECEKTITFINACSEQPGMSTYFGDLITKLKEETRTQKNALVNADLQATTIFGQMPVKIFPWISSAKTLRAHARAASDRMHGFQADLRSSTEIAKLMLATNAPLLSSAEQKARLDAIRSERRTLQQRMKQVFLCFNCLRKRARMERATTDVENVISMANLNLSNQNGGDAQAVPHHATPDSGPAAGGSGDGPDAPSSPVQTQTAASGSLDTQSPSDAGESCGVEDPDEGEPAGTGENIVTVEVMSGNLTLEEVVEAIAAAGVYPSEPSEYSTAPSEPSE